MKHLTKKSILIPILTAIICVILFTIPLGLNQLTMLTAMSVCVIASFIEYGKRGLKSLGFNKESLTLRQYLVAIPLLTIALFLFYGFILLPATTFLTSQEIDFSEFDQMQGNLTSCLILLIYIWTSAAIGEEIVFRGYFMQQIEKFFGKGKIAVTLNILILGVLFGLCHSYQGLTGQIVTAVIGILLSIIFHKFKNNLRVTILIHGLFDTFAVVCMYFGWY